jgi:hypothetical protein
MKKTKILSAIICLALIFTLMFVAVVPATKLAFGLEISETFDLEEQWYAAENHLDYAKTLEIITQQNFPADKEYYKENRLLSPLSIAERILNIPFLTACFLKTRAK